jgi:FixJ family two-component response regulator
MFSRASAPASRPSTSLWSAVAGLSERDRALVAAMQDGDMSAVAKALGMSVRSVQRLWKKLRERWDRRRTSER